MSNLNFRVIKIDKNIIFLFILVEYFLGNYFNNYNKDYLKINLIIQKISLLFFD